VFRTRQFMLNLTDKTHSMLVDHWHKAVHNYKEIMCNIKEHILQYTDKLYTMVKQSFYYTLNLFNMHIGISTPETVARTSES